MGDSLIKNVNSQELKERYGGYAQPSIKRKLNLILLHTGTNDLSLKIDGKEATELQIAEEIIDLAKPISEKVIEVDISCLITRDDRYESKRKRVNLLLQNFCSQYDFAFLEHNMQTDTLTEV